MVLWQAYPSYKDTLFICIRLLKNMDEFYSLLLSTRQKKVIGWTSQKIKTTTWWVLYRYSLQCIEGGKSNRPADVLIMVYREERHVPIFNHPRRWIYWGTLEERPDLQIDNQRNTEGSRLKNLKATMGGTYLKSQEIFLRESFCELQDSGKSHKDIADAATGAILWAILSEVQQYCWRWYWWTTLNTIVLWDW